MTIVQFRCLTKKSLSINSQYSCNFVVWLQMSLINLFGTSQYNISVNFLFAEALYYNSASGFSVPVFLKVFWYMDVCPLLSLGNFVNRERWSATAAHTVNNRLEYNLYTCSGYNWVCLFCDWFGFCLGFFFFPLNSWKNWLRRTTSFTSQPRKRTKLTSELMTPILWSRSMMSITWIFPKSASHLVLKFLHLLTSVSFCCSVSKPNFCLYKC